MQNSLCLVHLVAGTAVSDCIVCDFMYMMMCRMIMASFTCIEAFWNLGYVTNTCCVMQTRLDYDNHHVLFLFVIFVVYVVVADQLLRLRISQQTSSVSFMYQMSDLCRNNKLCYKCVFFLSLFYYERAYLWHVICQSTEIHYSEVLTVPQVNQTIKLYKNELNICKLCASDMCVTIFVHRNIWAQLFWLFHRSSCVHQCPS